MKNISSNVFVLIVGLCLALTGYSAEFKKPLTFPHGKSSTIVKGSVIRGDRDVYLIRVRAGQVMSVSITALEKNAAFSIYEPKTEDAIPGTEEENDPTEWSGTLSKSGEYRIVVGGTRGNASYQLQVKVE